MSKYEKFNAEVFEELSKIKLPDDQIETKGKLKYLSWSYAIGFMSKTFDDFEYNIKSFDGKPYLKDENLGYWVETSIKAGGVTKTCWLPVMDYTNKAMCIEPSQNKQPLQATSSQNKQPLQATFVDINKNIMRCLTKNIAMFGYGLYLYKKEDLPNINDDVDESVNDNVKENQQIVNRIQQDINNELEAKPIDKEAIKELLDKKHSNLTVDKVYFYFHTRNWRTSKGAPVTIKTIEWFIDNNYIK